MRAGVPIRLAASLAVAAFAAALALGLQSAGLLSSLEQRSVSARFEIRGAEPSRDLLVVAIDDATFSDLRKQWPFPRSLHARVIDRLKAAGARAIVYDVQFTEPTRPREDVALFDAIARARGVVLATTEFDERGRTLVLGGDDNVARAHARVGATNLPEGADGQLDRFPRAVHGVPSLAVAAAEEAGARRLPAKAFEPGGARIDFRGGPRTVPTVSFSAVLRGKVDPDLVRGRIVVVGATAPTLQDLHATPTSAHPMSGPELQANAIWTALHGLPLRNAPGPLDVLAVLALALIPPVLRRRWRVLPAALLTVVAGVGYALVAQLVFVQGSVIWVSAPLVALAAATVGMVVASHLAETQARRRALRDNDVLEERVRERTHQLRETQLEILRRLARAAEWRDEETGAHVERIGLLTQRLALRIGLDEDEAELLLHASTAHDVGKIGIPDRILLKPGRLTPEERTEMERHALIGAAMLGESDSPLLQLAETIARTHHERWDGTGYPAGLAGEDIPLAGRICAIVDVFDALVSERPYKHAWDLTEALDLLEAERGRHFDPELADAFLAIAPAAYAELYNAPAAQPALTAV
jgi:CHASE2 domain-containing sensor protein